MGRTKGYTPWDEAGTPWDKESMHASFRNGIETKS